MSTDEAALSMETKAMPWWLILIEGFLAIIVGILLFTSTAQTMVGLIVFLGLYWLIKGIFDIISMFVDHTAWGWKLFIGIIGILAGLLILRNPLMSTFVVPVIFTWVLGFYAIMAGIVMLIQAFKGGGWGIGILGVLSIIFGVLLLANIWVATLVLPWVFGILAIVGGIFALILAFRLR